LTNGPTFEPGGPFAGSTGGSVYFDGTGDYLSWSGTTMTGDFTVEAWVYKTANPAGYTNVFSSSSPNNQFTSGRFDKNSIGLVIGGSWVFYDVGSAVTLNAWHHMAWVREGSTCRGYVNGVQQNTGTSSGSVTLSDIGQFVGEAGYGMIGYISNARIINGTCLYPSGTTFTPPTKPLTPVSGTSLLTCQGGAIVDNSNNKFSITRNGNVRAIQSASITFDGTNDYATIPASSDFDISSGAYTVELYVNFIASPSVVILLGLAGTSTTGNAHLLYSGGALYWQTRGTGTNQTTYSWSPSLSRWYHLAVSWNGSNSLKLFIDGVEVASNTVSPTINQNGVNIGGASDGYSINGNISNVRIYKGKGLTAAEVQRNFNALRNRFGI